MKWLLLSPLVLLYGTTVHELVHGGAVLLTGGTLIELHLLPAYLDRLVFGYVDSTGGDPTWIKVAPALFSACVATFAYAWLPELKAGGTAFVCTVLFYVVPMFDVSMAAWGPVFGVHSDLWVLADHLVPLELAALLFITLHVANAPRLNLSPVLLLALMLAPATRFI